ncbi:MAG: type III pantothenate kinase [Phycisphaerales bacterium]
MANEQNQAGPEALRGSLVAACVGNTRTRVGLIRDGKVEEARSLGNEDVAELVAVCDKLRQDQDAAGVVIASVHLPVSRKLELELASKADVYVIGRDLEIPLSHGLDDASTVGQDRLLDALGAYGRLKEACVVADLGTAITIDFIDGQGTFQGGVIAPGVRTMLKALHASAPALPDLAFELPDPARGPFGKDTSHAMRLGVQNAVIGLLRYTVEQFADKYGAFPTVVATGGDAGLVENDPMVDRVVPDLQLMGVAEVCRLALQGGEEDDSLGED